MLTALAVHGFAARDRLPLSFVFQAGTVRQAIQLAAALRSGHRDATVRVHLRRRVLPSGPRWSVVLRTVPTVLCHSTIRRLELELDDTAARCEGTVLRGWRPILADGDAERVLGPGSGW
jgi:hypothetical protein